MELYELFNAISSDNLNQVAEILQNDPSLLNKYMYGVTPLMFSIECKTQAISMHLLTNNSPSIDLDLRDNLGMTCLEKAIETMHVSEFIDLLIKKMHRKSLNKMMSSNEGETLLTKAIKMNNNDTICRTLISNDEILNLVNRENKLKEHPLELTIRANKTDLLKLILEKLSSQNNELLGKMLIYTTENDLTDCALVLIEISTPMQILNAKKAHDEEEFTCLMYAILNNNELLVESLLEKCPQLIDIQEKQNGQTALHLAAENDSEFCVKLLLKYSANKTLRNHKKMTALDLAREDQNEDLIQLLC
jgi:ankyrin repeat protein